MSNLFLPGAGARLALAIVGGLLAGAAAAQHTLEIIPLRHATVDQVLPVLRPLLEPGGTLTGQGGQLIVRTSPANLDELRRVLEAVDRPRRRLQVLVRFDDRIEESRRELGVSGTVGGARAGVELRAEDSRMATAERVDQRLQVLEGGRAFISTGQSRPVPQRQVVRTPSGVIAQETFVVHEAATGFEVRPRLSGQGVLLDIAPQRQSATGEGQSLYTTVHARLGEWVEVGGAVESAAREARGLGGASAGTLGVARRVWVKVEAPGNE